MLTPAVTLIASFAVTAALTGLIWTIQLVHYPLFNRVGRDQFGHYHRLHQLRITWLVGPLMLAEVYFAFALFWDTPAGTTGALAELGLYLLATIWLSTSLVQVPQHRRLSRAFSERSLRLLVGTNWIRTSAWTARAAILSIMVTELVGYQPPPTVPAARIEAIDVSTAFIVEPPRFETTCQAGGYVDGWGCYGTQL